MSTPASSSAYFTARFMSAWKAKSLLLMYQTRTRIFTDQSPRLL